MKKVVKYILFPFVFIFGYLYFLISKKTSNLTFASFRFLFVTTNGRINDMMSKLISLFHPKNNSSQLHPSILNYTANELENISAEIQKKGYYEFEQILPEDLQDKLLDFAQKTPLRVLDVQAKGIQYLPNKRPIDFQEIIAPRYQFDQSDLVENEAIQKIIFDPFFKELAANYLNCEPILDLVTMWWSFPFQQKATSQAAQMYHFDMDRFKFIKFFFYLTDVHTDNGPHCYIENSHHRLPKSLREDRRITDEELKLVYPESVFKEFIGKKGTILAVDTRGLHKGKPLVKDARLLFQIQFSNSLFGAPYLKTRIQNNTLKKTKRTFQLYQA